MPVRNLVVGSVSIAVALLACGCASTTRDAAAPAASPLLDFSAVGCSRDFPGPDSLRTQVERELRDDTVAFVVRHPDACGMRGRDPSFTVEADVLRLRYDLEELSGMHLLCECEYRATFVFDRSMEHIQRVRLNDGPAIPVR